MSTVEITDSSLGFRPRPYLALGYKAGILAMGAIVQFGRKKAILRHAEWRCSDIHLEHRLNQVTADWVRDCGGPALGIADADYEAAKAISRMVGGKVVCYVQARTSTVRRTWFRQRQLRLFQD